MQKMVSFKALVRTVALATGVLCVQGCDGAATADSPKSGDALNIPMELTQQGPGSSVSFMTAKGQTRTIDFTVDEGTHLSVDMSPDGRWILFDLLGHIYRMPAGGGEAISLTQGSGVALNFHPAWSPDGSQIAFISDRSGQDNVWVMNADGSDPRPVILDPDSRFTDPDWHPDGNSLVAIRIFPSPGRGWHRRQMTLARLSLDNGDASELLRGQLEHYSAPTFAPDGKSLYFQTEYSTWRGNGLLNEGHRIQRMNLATGEVTNVRLDQPAQISDAYREALAATSYAAVVKGDPPAALSPEVSPSGRYMAFAIERPEAQLDYRGHVFEGHTGVMVRDLQTGEERLLIEKATRDMAQANSQYAYKPFPGFSWTPDESALIISFDGKIKRVKLQDGGVETLPFEARVQRTLSEQVRSDVLIEDKAFTAKFLQWPVSSPDGSQLVFVAVGRLWTMALPDGAPQLLTTDMPGAVQLTPDFAPDGSSVVFATWSDSEGGQVWEVSAQGGEARRLTRTAAQYLYPAYSPDGAQILITRGPQALWPAFTTPGPGLSKETKAADGDQSRWRFVLLDPASGNQSTVLPLEKPQRGSFLADGRVVAQRQDDIGASFDLRSPYPDEAARQQVVRVQSFKHDGALVRTHAQLPPRVDFFGGSNRPLLSPDGSWLAYEAGRSVYVVPIEGGSDALTIVNSDPNTDMPGRVRVGDQGGIYPHWRDDATLEFMSGRVHITYDVASGEMSKREIALRIPRDVPAGRIALTGARIITVDGDRVIEHGTIIVDGSRIVCVGACDTTDVDREIDASGKTIIPGLVDVHSHSTGIPGGVVTRYWPDAALNLAYGVTTIIDPAAESRSAFPMAEMIESGVLAGPRTYSSAEVVITQTYAWGDNLEVTSAENAAFNARYRARWGAIELKNYRLASRRQHQYLIDAAREIPITVTGEGGPLFANIGYAMDGQTGWEHFAAPLPLYRDATEFMGRAGIHYSPTVNVAGHVHGAMQYYRQFQSLLEDDKYNRFIPRSDLEQKHSAVVDRPKSSFSFAIVAEGLKDILRAGGYGALGEHGEQPGIGTHWELWSYAEALTPLEALTVGSYGGAHFVGLDKEIGSIEVGKIADLIVLNSNPLDDIRNTTDIAWVIKAGNIYDGDTLDRVWPDQQSFGTPPWVPR